MGGRLLEGPTMAGTILDWRKELERWLKPFLERLGHKTRRQMCPVYISGLIGPGERKSIQPMAERVAFGTYDQLHHFVSAGVWDVAPMETELLVQADKLVGGRDAVLVIDDTAVLKKGTHSVGVAPQYCSALGKIANCQTLVSLTLARGEVPVMAAMRLFLPESWTNDRARLKRAGVPVEYRTARTKPEIALAEIDRVIAAGVRFGCVLADAGYGMSAPFRQGLTARKLNWAVGIPRHLKVYPADVQMIDWLRGAAVPVGPFQILCQSRLNTYWPRPSGKTSVGAPAQRENLGLASLPSVCASPTDHRSGSTTRRINICQGSKLGSSANTGLPERRNTISRTYPRRPSFALWQPRSRRDGSASRRTSN